VSSARIMLNVAMFGNTVPCSPYSNRCFGGTNRLHLQDPKSAEPETCVRCLRVILPGIGTARPYISEDGKILNYGYENREYCILFLLFFVHSWKEYFENSLLQYVPLLLYRTGWERRRSRRGDQETRRQQDSIDKETCAPNKFHRRNGQP
jgi:hypothetical protein